LFSVRKVGTSWLEETFKERKYQPTLETRTHQNEKEAFIISGFDPDSVDTVGLYAAIRLADSGTLGEWLSRRNRGPETPDELHGRILPALSGRG
jgi:hypothetical protein